MQLTCDSTVKPHEKMTYERDEGDSVNGGQRMRSDSLKGF